MSNGKQGAKSKTADGKAGKRTGTAEKKTGSGQRRAQRATVRDKIFTWPFGRRNLVFLVIALVVIIAGYIFLGMGDHDSFTSLNIAPILLVIGYMILIPLAIILRDPEREEKRDR